MRFTSYVKGVYETEELCLNVKNKLYIWHTQANTSSSSFTTFSFSLLSSSEFMMAANFLPASFLLFL